MIIKKYNRQQALKNKEELILQIEDIIKDSWGEFPEAFLIEHVIDSERVLLAQSHGQIVAVCSMDVLTVNKKHIYYIEFLAVKKKYQFHRIGSKLIKSMIVFAFVRNLFILPFRPLEVMFITPNIQVLSLAARIANFIYPNPYRLKIDGTIDEADDETWRMAQEVLHRSDRPERELRREGNVLIGSYENMPWLIYSGKNIPWHRKEVINNFAKRYLGYGKQEDKEFIVRMQLSLGSIIKYIFKV